MIPTSIIFFNLNATLGSLRSMFTIYTKSDCVYCTKVKALLPDAVVIDCDDRLLQDRPGFLREMEARIGRPYRMFPMVFLDDQFLGGYEETKAYLAVINFTEDF